MLSMKKSVLYSIFLLNLGFIIWFWLGSSRAFLEGTGYMQLIAWGRVVGLVAEYAVLLQLILIGRISWIEQVFGHDRMNRMHRFVGYSVIFFLLAHPTLLIVGYAGISGVSFLGQTMDFLVHKDDVLKAAVGLCIFAFVIAVSVPVVRKRLRYETWYFTHLLLYLAILLAFDHQVKFGDFEGNTTRIAYWYALNFAVFGAFGAYRFLRPVWRMYRHRFRVDRVVQETHDVWSIYISGRDIGAFMFQPGQFANLSFLTRGFWFSHPFSFSVAPNSEYIRFSVKASGDFTDKIALIPVGTYVIVDGPLGIFTEASAVRGKFLFIAGGIGITPIRALTESLLREHRDMVLLYGNKTAEDIVFAREFADYHMPMHVVLSQTAGAGAYETGHIDKEKIQRLVPDFKDREVFLCGPVGMMDTVVYALRELGLPSSQIHFEKFSY